MASLTFRKEMVSVSTEVQWGQIRSSLGVLGFVYLPLSIFNSGRSYGILIIFLVIALSEKVSDNLVCSAYLNHC